MEIQELKQLSIELMDAAVSRKLAEFSLETEEFQISMKTQEPPQIVMQAAAPAPMPMESSQTAVSADSAAEDIPAGTRVEAPLVGIYYSAPTPNDPPFVEVGQKVAKGDTLFIIEAMKTMNEIAAPCDGTVSRIYAQNGDMVEYKQLMLIIE